MVCERFLNVYSTKQSGKKFAVGRVPLAAGAYNGTAGTMVNRALNVDDDDDDEFGLRSRPMMIERCVRCRHLPPWLMQGYGVGGASHRTHSDSQIKRYFTKYVQSYMH